MIFKSFFFVILECASGLKSFCESILYFLTDEFHWIWSYLIRLMTFVIVFYVLMLKQLFKILLEENLSSNLMLPVILVALSFLNRIWKQLGEAPKFFFCIWVLVDGNIRPMTDNLSLPIRHSHSDFNRKLPLIPTSTFSFTTHTTKKLSFPFANDFWLH